MADIRGLPLLSGPPPPIETTNSTVDACRKCNKEFNILFTRSRKCNHCGYSYCHNCTDYQAMMPRAGSGAASTGYDAVPVCAFCIELLNITAAGRHQLKSMSLAKLKRYINAYNIKIDRAVEKDDLIDAIVFSKGPNGCLPPANENYYRKYSVPNKPPGRPRGLFSRQQGQSSQDPPPPAIPPRTNNTPEFARPDLEPDGPPPPPPPSHPYPQMQPQHTTYPPPPHPPPPQQQQYSAPPYPPPPPRPRSAYGNVPPQPPQNPPPQFHTAPPHGNAYRRPPPPPTSQAPPPPNYSRPPPPQPPPQQQPPPPQNYHTRPTPRYPSQPSPPPPSSSHPYSFPHAQPHPPFPHAHSHPPHPPPPPQQQYSQPPPPPPRPRAASTPTPAPAPPPTLDELLAMPAPAISALSISALKAVLFTNHVSAGQILEKGDLVRKVVGLVEDERAERERMRRVEEREEMERVQREEERREREEEARRERERRERGGAQMDGSGEDGEGMDSEEEDEGAGEEGSQSDYHPEPSSSPPKVAPAPTPALAPKAQASASMLERTGLCVICQDEEANIAIVDCGHMAMCRACSDLVMASSRECPLCRTRIVTEARLLRIFKT